MPLTCHVQKKVMLFSYKTVKELHRGYLIGF